MKRLLPAAPATALSAALLLVSCGVDLDFDKYAIVYGIEEYAGSHLDWAADDGLEMKALLQSQGFQVVNADTEKALKGDVETAFNQVNNLAGKDDLFVFYFSGHGGQGTPAGEEPPEGDEPQEFIALSNGTADEFLSDDELAALIRSVPANKKIVLLDACYSGGFIGNELETGGRNGFFGNLNTALSLFCNFSDDPSDISPGDAMVISACGEQEYSWESSQYGNGVFTYYLLKAADRGDRNRDSFVTVTETFAYVREKIMEDWNGKYSNADMSSQVSGGPVDFLLFE